MRIKPVLIRYYIKLFILTKSTAIYCEKIKNHNVLWFFWCSRRESNPKLNLRRIPLFPFNYGNLLNDLKDKKSEK